MSQFQVVRSDPSKEIAPASADAYRAWQRYSKIERSCRLPGARRRARSAPCSVAGAGLVALSLVLPHPSGGDNAALIAHRRGDGASPGCSAGLLAAASRCRGDAPGSSPATAAVAGAADLRERRRRRPVRLDLRLGDPGRRLLLPAPGGRSPTSPGCSASTPSPWLLVESTAGYSPLTRWLFTAVSLTVVMLLTSAIVARRAQADLRARRFFDLSHDMLCTADMKGYFVELNSAWERCLGYSAEELRAAPVPRPRPPRGPQAHRSRGGRASSKARRRSASRTATWPRTAAGTGCAGARRWLADESLIYARATDVTELKRVEAEREKLLGRGRRSWPASDALTGLPNRRGAGRAAAARDGAGPPRRVRPLPGDRRHRPLQGLQRHPRPPRRRRGAARLRDRLGRGAARRRHDRPLRRRGVPRRPARLPARAGGGDRSSGCGRRPPAGQTCSAGLACWDYAESDRRPARPRRQRPLPGQGRRPRPARASRPPIES